MTDHLVALAVLPLWLTAACGWAVGAATNVLTRPWSFL